MQEVNPEMVVIARESRGLSQSVLADMMGISQGILSKIETGSKKVSEDILRKLEDA
jgi:ribosome-binding protein aMBF1 (putative translation factor)